MNVGETFIATHIDPGDYANWRSLASHIGKVYGAYWKFRKKENKIYITRII